MKRFCLFSPALWLLLAMAARGMEIREQDAGGAFLVLERGKPILRYIYHTVQPGALLSRIAPDNLKYARARSGYIHPLFGPHEEELTLDWPIDHPHHRGIYWAWPEVEYNGKIGDLHALQNVFARPGPAPRVSSSSDSAVIEAQSQWMWEDREAIVQERAVIQASAGPSDSRVIDLRFEFTALKDGVTIARRGKDKYGGLNLRFTAVRDQQIALHTDLEGEKPRMAWSQLSGRFGPATNFTTVLILQRETNPCYPGDWIQFPEINWVQPTFPSAGTRYQLSKDKPLVLEFRLAIYDGGIRAEDFCRREWRALNNPPASAANKP